MADPFLTCRIDTAVGALRVHARFDLRAPWTCLFGPSGSGKTTILRAFAGFVRPRTGILRLRSGRTLFDSSRRIFVPAHRRPFRIALQRSWLFPGDVRDNLRAGMPIRNPSLEQEVFALFELEHLAGADVRTLSGGERQRVSLARTVASALGSPEPVSLLLLDEPFTGFDLARRNRLAPALRHLLRRHELPVLSVTHDVPEALLLEAETIRLHDGQIVGQGPAARVLEPEIALLHHHLSCFAARETPASRPGSPPSEERV